MLVLNIIIHHYLARKCSKINSTGKFSEKIINFYLISLVFFAAIMTSDCDTVGKDKQWDLENYFVCVINIFII